MSMVKRENLTLNERGDLVKRIRAEGERLISAGKHEDGQMCFFHAATLQAETDRLIAAGYFIDSAVCKRGKFGPIPTGIRDGKPKGIAWLRQHGFVNHDTRGFERSEPRAAA